jgi:DNA modification methylase
LKPYYSHAGIEIYLGDCREILPSMPRFDLCLTDPPYGIFLNGGKWGEKFGGGLDWDKEPAGNMRQLLECGSEQVIWGGNYFSLPPSRGWLVWHKPDSTPSTADVELAWTSRDMNSRLLLHSIAATNGERVPHPTQKPLRVMRWALSFFPEAKSVIDPYCGSGTTLIAAKNLGIPAIGIEIEERFCELSAKRLSQEVFDFK